MNKADPSSGEGVPSSDVHCGYGGDVNLRNSEGICCEEDRGRGEEDCWRKEEGSGTESHENQSASSVCP